MRANGDQLQQISALVEAGIITLVITAPFLSKQRQRRLNTSSRDEQKARSLFRSNEYAAFR
jgi:hypothetical protein